MRKNDNAVSDCSCLQSNLPEQPIRRGTRSVYPVVWDGSSVMGAAYPDMDVKAGDISR